MPTPAHAVMLSVPWECVASVESGFVQPLTPGAKVRIDVEFNARGTMYIAKGSREKWSALLARTSAGKGTLDPFNCLWKVADSIEEQAEAACREHHREAGARTIRKKCSEKRITRAMQPLEDGLSSVGEGVPKFFPGILPMESLTDADFERFRPGLEELAQDMEESCRLFPDPTHPAAQAVRSRQFLEQILPGVLARAPHCRFALLSDLDENLANRLENCQDATSPVCMRIRTSAGKLRSYLAIHTPVADPQNASCAVPANDLEQVIEVMSRELEEAYECEPLEAGEFRMAVTGPIDPAPAFRLTRTEEGHLAEIRLRFTPESEDATYREKVDDCLRDTANPRLRAGDPPASRRLQLALSTDETVPVTEISLADDEFRSNSGEWESDIDCETIIHELMHVLGQVDEYEEFEDGFVMEEKHGEPSYRWANEGEAADETAYPCRAEGPLESIMNDQYIAMEDAQVEDKSFLSGAQLQAILFPNCRRRNETFVACASRAYWSPSDEDIAAGDVDCGLPALPACDNEEWLR